MTFFVVVVLEFLIVSITILVRIFILRERASAQLAKCVVGIEATSVRTMGSVQGSSGFIPIFQCSRSCRSDDCIITAPVLNLSADSYLN
jgi:hypothetical protein